MIFYLFIAINSLFTAAITFIVATGKIIDRRKKLFFTKRGVYFICCCFLLIASAFLQNYYLQEEQKAKDNAVKVEQNLRDSIMSAKHDRSILNLKLSYDTSTSAIISKTDSSNFKIIKALAENGLKFDDKQNTIAKLVKDVTTVSPTLICSNEKGTLGFESKNNDNHFTYTFLSKGATSTNINISAQIALTNNLKNTLEFVAISPKTNWWVEEFTIAENHTSIGETGISPNPYNYVVIWCKGNYQNIDKNKTFLFDEIFIYSYKENIATTMTAKQVKKQMKDWFNKIPDNQ